MKLSPRHDLLETFRPDIIQSLALTWLTADLTLPVDHHLLGQGPSLTKDALTIGLLEGELVKQKDRSLRGILSLSSEGRYLTRRMLLRNGVGVRLRRFRKGEP